jgi:arginine-tRNA-protein transferase
MSGTAMAERPVINEPITSPQADYDSLRYVSAETPCPYLPGLMFRAESYYVDQFEGRSYERLMARGFRRSGRIVYRPRCRGCRECRQLRVLVGEFVPTRSMRRVWRRNADVSVTVQPAEPTGEKYEMFRRYLDFQHDGAMSRGYDAFVDFLYESPVESVELVYSLGKRVIAAGIVDECPGGYSSVYVYFDPDHARRSLGTFAALWEIAHCKKRGLPYYYLGYFVAGSPTMSYKARFRPNQVLAGDDRWISFRM